MPYNKSMAYLKDDFLIKNAPLNDGTVLYAYLGSETIVKVPDGVTFISSLSFADKNNPNDTITKIILPDSVKEIDTQAFAYCHKLKEIRLPNNDDFKVLGIQLFRECLSLEKITIPKSVHAIVSFMIPPNLKMIELHEDLTLITQSSFTRENSEREDKNYSNGETIKLLLNNENYKIVDGFMVNVKRRIALFYVDRNKKIVSIPEGIKRLSSYCFDEYGYFDLGYDENEYLKTKLTPIEKIIIPKTVKEISVGAFYYCKNLKSVEYKGKSSDFVIAERAFINCDIDSINCVDSRNSTKMSLERLVIIHRKIKAGNFPSTNKLRDYCREELGSGKLSTSTISRDIEFLRTRFNAPIEYDSSKKGYFYSEDFEQILKRKKNKTSITF